MRGPCPLHPFHLQERPLTAITTEQTTASSSKKNAIGNISLSMNQLYGKVRFPTVHLAEKCRMALHICLFTTSCASKTNIEAHKQDRLPWYLLLIIYKHGTARRAYVKLAHGRHQILRIGQLTYAHFTLPDVLHQNVRVRPTERAGFPL